MNTLTTLGATLLLATSTFAANANANATEFTAADNTIGTQLCMAVAKDNKLVLKNAMAKVRISKYTMTKKLTCNDLSVENFAATYGLVQSARHLNLDMNTSTSIRDLAAKNRSDVLVVSGSK